MSKKVEKFIVAEANGLFLSGYENRKGGGLAFKADYTRDVSRALCTPYSIIENDLEQFEMFEKLAKTFDCRLLVIEAEYSFTDLDGKPVEVEEQEKPTLENLLDDLEKLADMLGVEVEEAGGDDED